jgi:PKD repeat protein
MHISSLTTLFFLLVVVSSWSQSVSFTVPANACIDQRITPDNTSTGTSAAEWDFCEGDLTLLPAAAGLGSLAGNQSHGIEPVFDGANWYAFIAVKDDDNIIRLDFGSSLDNPAPAKTNLGNLSGALDNPLDIELVFAAGKWYGFTYNASSKFITRIDFGTSLTTGAASLTTTQIVTGTGSAYSGLEVIAEAGNWFIVYTTEKAVTVARLNSIESIPQPSDFVTTGDVSDFDFLGDIRVIKSNGKWFGFTVTVGNLGVFRLSFGANLFSVPTYQDITDASWLGSALPLGLDIGRDNNTNLVFIITNFGVVRLDVGLDPDTDPVVGTNLGNFGVLQSAYKITLVKHAGRWHGFTCAAFSDGVYRLTFPNMDCKESQALSVEFEPIVTYSSAGIKHITLRGYYDAINYLEAHESINVSSSVSPSVDFTNIGVCATNPTLFTYQGSTAASYAWDFGDASTSTAANPQHSYALPGNYQVNLLATSANGCENTIGHTLKVYGTPVAEFNLPSGLICTGNEFTFVNTTVDSFDGNLSFDWRVDSESVSNQPDLHYTFTSTGDKSIELVASIPGCDNVEQKTLPGVQTGPAVGFTISGQCQDDTIVFTNTSTGSIAGYSWQLDGANADDSQHFSFPSATIGDHTVKLEVSGLNGCLSIESKLFKVYSKPAANFFLDLPPFSCTGSPSQFHDITPTLTDSNVISWSWSFGDGTTTTGKDPTHIYLQSGLKSVGLEVTTDRGCQDQIFKQVTISPSPTASFTNDPACIAKPTQFYGTVSTTAKSWAWKIGSTTYSVQNPTHVFPASSEYNVELTATATNNCLGKATKKIVVPVVPVIDFTVSNPCEGQNVVLSASITGTTDMATSYQWNFVDGVTGTGEIVNRTFPSAGIQPVTLASQHVSGCSYSATKNVTIHSVPVASFSPTTVYGAAPLSVSFTNSSVGAVSYEWRFDNGGEVTVASPTQVFYELGVHDVSLKATNAQGCSDDANGEVHVIVPHTDLSITSLVFATDANGQTRGVLNLKNNSNYPVASFDLVIESGGSVLINENTAVELAPFSEQTIVTRNSLTFVGGGSVYVCVTVELEGDEDPGNNRQCQTATSESVALEPYPNPAKGTLMIQFISSTADELDIRLINETGADAYSVKVAVIPGLNVLNLDVSNLGPGLYVVKAMSSTSLITRRVFISN